MSNSSPCKADLPRINPPRALAGLLAVLAGWAGCSKGGTPAVDSGSGPPDVCNSQSDAQTQAACQLTLGKQSQYYIDHLGKELWLAVTLPTGLTSKSLLQIEAGYSSEVGSPVQLSVNVFTAAQASLASAVDDHGAGPPGVINIITAAPTAEAGQQIFIVCSDDANQYYDDRDPFFITASVVTDPDPNLPGIPTVIALTPGATSGVVQNSPPSPGVLSTPNRVDEYALTIPSGIARPILYFSITVPPLADGGVLDPPLQYLMSYTLYDCGTTSASACAGNPPTTLPGGSVVATDHQPNQFVTVDLATARLVNPGDTYVIEVAGWQDPQNPSSVPGDMRATYQLAVEVMPDIDVNEPNDAQGQAKAITSLTLDDRSGTNVTGRLSYVPDYDWFRIDVPASGNNTRLYYTLTPGTGPGRFPALPSSPQRVLTVSTPVAASAEPDPGLACRTDYATCPNDLANVTGASGSESSPAVGLAEQYCDNANDGGPLCLLSYRLEFQNYNDLSNFQGILQVPAHGATQSYYLLYSDQGGAWADDVPYTLNVQWLSESADKLHGYHNSEATAAQVTLVEDPAAATYPVPPGDATQLSGSITVGNTLLSQIDPTSGQGVHAADDYDAIPSSLDVWEVDFPAISPIPSVGSSWELQWQIQDTGPGGTRPYDLGIAPEFCDSSGNCTPTQQTPDPFDGIDTFGYSAGTVTPWWTSNHLQVWDFANGGGKATITAGPLGCFCFEPSYLAGGKFYLKVIGVDRTSYVDATYQIQMALTHYPPPGDAGCPTVDAGFADGGSFDAGDRPVVTGCRMSPQPGQ